MIKNCIYLTLIIFSFLFFFGVTKQYLSDFNRKKIDINRSTIEHNIKNTNNLKVLINDTNNVIEFNNGYNLNEKTKSKKNFWKLFEN